MPDLPTGTVTFLFTDLEGSTRLWEEHPDAMRAALARHDEILRDAVESHHGHVVKTTGDGLHAAFATAPDAAFAAVDAQLALAAETWGDVPLEVRMGLHTGAAEVRDGDYYGPAVNRAARVSAAAHGSQIVVSHATEELLRDDLPPGSALSDLGEHRLRDLARPERVYQLDAPGLPSEFPSLRSIDAFPTNLPGQLTSFVGRDDEITALGKALTETRLVTLTGVGGVGKTRLATQLAAEVLPHYPDGAWLCELAAATDPDALAQVVAATLGANPRPGVTLEESIVDFLRARELLLVLDNCEHLLSAAGELAEDILRACPGVRIVATSREGLAVTGEQVWPLRSLGVPRRGRESGVDAAAVRLFADRARAVRPGFELDGPNGDAVGEICRRLDGIPLAIELAAARVESMSAPEIAELLDERFRLLTGGRRTAVERHQTLRAAVDWSYSMLSDTERLVYERLGVFSGTFDAAAATAVVSGDGVEEWDVRDALGALVAKSLVTREETDAGVTRYLLLETLRQYARERLDEANQTDTWRRRHAQHYAAFAEEAGPALVGRDELAWRPRVGEEIDNLRAAVLWGLDSQAPDDVELAIRIIAALGYESTMRRSAGIAAWADEAVAKLGSTTPGRRCAVLGAAAFAASYVGEIARAETLAREAMQDGIPDDCPTPVTAPVALALSHSMFGRPADALQVMLDVSASDPASRGWSTFDVSNVHATTATWAMLSDHLDIARHEAAEALRTAREAGNPSALVIALFGVAWAAEEEDPDRALAALEELVALTEAGASDIMLASSLAIIGKLTARAGEPGRAAAALRRGFLHAHRDGDRPTFFGNAPYAVIALVELGRPDLAVSLHGATTPGARALGEMAAMFAPHTGRERDAAIAEARRRLGDERADELVELGRSMDYEQLASHLLAELERFEAELDEAATESLDA